MQVDVNVQTTFLPDQSNPGRLEYVFAYTISITNRGDKRVQLLNRHWLITDANENQETVDGSGVVGKQPILDPGESFSYTSGCVLKTEFGSMEGHYEFEDADGELFNVPIPAFILALPADTLN